MSEEINEIIKFCSTKIPLFRNRDYVEALWSGIPSNKDQWFTGAVVSHRLLCTRGFKNTFVYDIEFIDGDFEYSIPEEKIRKCSHAVYAKEMKLLQLKIEGEKEINNKKMAAKRKRCSRGAGAKEEEESEMNVLERDQQREQEVLGPKKKKSKASILGAIDCTPTTKQHKSSCIPLFRPLQCPVRRLALVVLLRERLRLVATLTQKADGDLVVQVKGCAKLEQDP